MGTRIHKVMGYGAKIANHRELFELLYEDRTDGEVSQALDDYRSKIENEFDRFDLKLWSARCHYHNQLHQHRKYHRDYPRFFRDLIHYAEHPDDEDGYTVIVPPGCPDWYRYDDMLDYTEASILNPDNPLESRLTVLDHGLYPWVGLMSPTGERMKDAFPVWEAKRLNPELVPFVPYHIRAIAEAVSIDWLQLRPVVATWWC
jgi:hypothetical protein